MSLFDEVWAKVDEVREKNEALAKEWVEANTSGIRASVLAAAAKEDIRCEYGVPVPALHRTKILAQLRSTEMFRGFMFSDLTRGQEEYFLVVNWNKKPAKKRKKVEAKQWVTDEDRDKNKDERR